MENHPKSAFVRSRSSPLSLPCLVVFPAYLLLPAIYYSHLTEALLPALYVDPRAGPLAIVTHPYSQASSSRLKIYINFFSYHSTKPLHHIIIIT